MRLSFASSQKSKRPTTKAYAFMRRSLHAKAWEFVLKRECPWLDNEQLNTVASSLSLGSFGKSRCRDNSPVSYGGHVEKLNAELLDVRHIQRFLFFLDFICLKGAYHAR